MTFRISNAAASAMVTAFGDALDGGSLELYTGSPPTNIGDATGETLLATLTFNTPGTDDPSANVLTLDLPVDSTAIAAGTIGWGRAKKSDSTIMCDGTVTLSGGGGDFIASELVVAIDDDVSIVAMTFTLPKQ